jgi:hypothetical protein
MKSRQTEGESSQKWNDRKAFRLDELPEWMVRAIATAPIDPAFAAYDHETPEKP